MAIELTREQQVFIVTELAVYSRPSEVKAMLKARWDIDVNISTITYYDPTTVSECAKEWRDLFDEARAICLKHWARVPIMEKSYRARRLQKILDTEEDRGNTVGARETLEQAAKEEGGAYTNRREFTGKDGGPVQTSGVVLYLPDNGRSRS